MSREPHTTPARSPRMDTFTEIVDLLIDRARQHWLELVSALAFAAVGWVLGNWRAKRNWRRREFFDRVNFSLTRLDPADDPDRKGAVPTVRIRTLMETTCESVFLNDAARDAVLAAARRTSPADPTLPLPERDYWQYLNAVLNELSEMFAEGHLRQDLGYPVRTETYLVSLTSEVAGEIRTRKVRAMVVKKSLLTDLPRTNPLFEHATHKTRWDTLKLLAAEYEQRPWKFLEVELSL